MSHRVEHVDGFPRADGDGFEYLVTVVDEESIEYDQHDPRDPSSVRRRADLKTVVMSEPPGRGDRVELSGGEA